MKCKKCSNDFPSRYYFSTPQICNDCFKKLPPEEQEALKKDSEAFAQVQPETLREQVLKHFGIGILLWLCLPLIFYAVKNDLVFSGVGPVLLFCFVYGLVRVIRGFSTLFRILKTSKS